MRQMQTLKYDKIDLVIDDIRHEIEWLKTDLDCIRESDQIESTSLISGKIQGLEIALKWLSE